MHGAFFKGACSSVAVQAFSVVEGLVEFDMFGCGWRSQVIHVDMPKPTQLGLDCAEHSVIRVACVASRIGRNPMILKMGGRQVLRIVHIEALAVWFHDVTRKTELSAFCVFQFAGSSNSKAEKRQRKQRQKCHHFSAAGCCSLRPKDENGDQDDAECNQ